MCGALRLSGLLYIPTVTLRPLCITLAHGFTASKESMDGLAGYLVRRGFTCLTFDFRGHKLGASEGKMLSAGDVTEDMLAAAKECMRLCGMEHVVLAGHSMGCLAAISAAVRLPETVGVVVIATGTKPAKSFKSIVGAAMLHQREDYVCGAPAITLLEEMSTLAEGLSGLGSLSSLFVAARGDVLVRTARMQEMAAKAGERAEYSEVDGQHMDAPSRARNVVALWLERLLLTVEGVAAR